ncbi:MAG: N-6 DNA methylase [Bacteroidales bacterium]|nr:N-6 DNA methylase [Bacteroidales bacterium]
MINKETAYNKIAELVARFSEQIDSYKKTSYNETQTRRDFIDPFFKALGWDIDNEEGYAEAYREVIHEDRVKVGRATKAPDYSFRLSGGKRLFFVEAKKPSIAIKNDILPAYQVRRYGWSAKLPISVITDFEEFAIYDCTKKPLPKDKASVARIKYLTYNNYLTEFDFLWDTFSKERVLKGSFDKFIKGTANKKGTATVDKEFLISLDNWRSYLATAISWHNKELDEDELNYVVQITIDRLIFLRIAEDRGVEPYGNLKTALKQGDYYKNLFLIFKDADAKYNSGLFDFKKDAISQNLSIPNKIIKVILSEMYYPESPYEFSVLSVEILGSAYEQFLGKVIRITPAHHAKIEEKPEVRKAGGVYYTPEYIVEYIVKNTVGKLIKGKKPDDISNLKIVDPACGSGSFLLGAYQYLLDYHKNYYSKKGKVSKGKKNNPLTPEGNLTSAEKKRILLNNIYGVDIDVNAVEVTKLSLLLKAMEGETSASIANQFSLFHERVLPTLEHNIKSGNSLIDIDFYAYELDFGLEKKVKPFSWQKAFPLVFKQGGFDAVIGNPPWVDIKGHPKELTDYYFKKFKTTANRINLYAIFIEQGLTLMNEKGKFGFIIPNSILFQSSYENLRRFIFEKWGIEDIIRLPDNTFERVKAETIIITIGSEKKEAECIIYDRKDTISDISIKNAKEVNLINTKDCLKNEYASLDIFSNKTIKSLLNKIDENKIELQSQCELTLGITPYDKYKGHSENQIKERVFHSATQKNETFKPVLQGADVSRYYIKWGEKEYISYGDWLGAPRQKKFFTEERILVRQIISGNPMKIYAGYTNLELYNTQSIFNIILKSDAIINIKYLLGILNSNLINFYHKNKYLDLSKNLFQKILIQNCKRFPLPQFTTENKISIDEITKLVDQLLQLNQEKAETKIPSRIEQIQSKIDYFENSINQIVYQLYNLTEEEIAIVEKSIN